MKCYRCTDRANVWLYGVDCGVPRLSKLKLPHNNALEVIDPAYPRDVTRIQTPRSKYHWVNSTLNSSEI